MTKLSLSIMALMATITITTPFRHGHHHRYPSRSYRPRIFGGEELVKYEYRHLVNIRQNGEHYCGGSIFTHNLVLTAAHCVLKSEDAYLITAGDHSRSIVEGTEQPRKIRRIIRHDEYVEGVFANDIALVQVERSFNFNDVVSLVRLVRPNIWPTATAIVMGWGVTMRGGQASDVPKKLTVGFVDRETCLRTNPMLATGDMCYGGVKSEGICFFDSGGPLMCDGLQCGIPIYSRGCGIGEPDMYTDVRQYLDWIYDTMDLFEP